MPDEMKVVETGTIGAYTYTLEQNGKHYRVFLGERYVGGYDTIAKCHEMLTSQVPAMMAAKIIRLTTEIAELAEELKNVRLVKG